MNVLPEIRPRHEQSSSVPDFETLVAALPEGQREVITMLKAGGLTLEEVARATSSTVGAVKQKAHRAYQKLRTVIEARKQELRREELHGLP
jgi:RNA polymerase sigma-70 factor (ECF subfamily)